MRQIFLDTETTGLMTADGHRIIEIGCIEMVNRRITGNNLHLYLNPERQIDIAASEVHGITLDQLLDKPKFREVVGRFLDFVRGADLIIHNAPFDMGFLEYELSLLGQEPLRPQLNEVIDTLVMAKQMFPGKRKSLDSLCERFGISNAHRVHHGALLDAGLLAEVYLSMTRGQETLEISIENEIKGRQDEGPWPPLLVPIYVSDDEVVEHLNTLKNINKECGGKVLWSDLSADSIGHQRQSLS